MSGANGGILRTGWVLGLSLLLCCRAGADDDIDSSSVAGPGLVPAPVAAEGGRGDVLSGLWRDLRADFRNVFTSKQNLAVVGAGLGAAVGAHQVDGRIARSRFNSELDEGAPLDRVFEAGEIAGGGIVQIGGAVGTYGLGTLLSKSGMRDLGRDLFRAQVVTQFFTVGLKYAVGRERPDHTNHQSFPSGHASASFATATVLQRRYGARAGFPAYVLAGYIASSRLNEGAHFLSDVVFGAAIGLVGGRSAAIDLRGSRVVVHPTVLPDGAGLRVTLHGPGPFRESARPSRGVSNPCAASPY